MTHTLVPICKSFSSQVTFPHNFRTFSIANLTADEVRFTIVNEDTNDVKEVRSVVCNSSRGIIEPGKKTEVLFLQQNGMFQMNFC